VRLTAFAVLSLAGLAADCLLCRAAAQQTGPASSQAALVPPAAGKLVGEPAVQKVSGGHQIAFALTAPSDVTVRIVDAKGQVVRHLAAGMVGLEKAAGPLAAGSLAQRLLWDGRDDAGKDVAAAGCKVSIGVGAAAKFDKFILYHPDGFGNVGTPNWSGLGCIAVGPKGDLYVVQQYGVHYSTMRVFSREGRFIRCVWPLSIDKPR
jgi:hypothetical protein